MAGVTLDAGALIAAARGKTPIWAFAKEANRRGEILTVPAPVLAQAWRGPRNARLSQFLHLCWVEAMDERIAKRAGELCGRSRTPDVVDAAVVVGAARRKDVIVTSDTLELRVLAAHAARVRVLDLNQLD